MSILAPERIVLSTPLVTTHGSIRAQQRGVSFDTLHLIACYGKKTRVKEGKFSRIIRQQEAKKILYMNIAPASLVERTKGITIITDESGNEIRIVTVHPRDRRHSFSRFRV